MYFDVVRQDAIVASANVWGYDYEAFLPVWSTFSIAENHTRVNSFSANIAALHKTTPICDGAVASPSPALTRSQPERRRGRVGR